MPFWQSHNNCPLPSPDAVTNDNHSISDFRIPTPPNTDIWRRSDESDVFTAPLLYHALPARTFKSISVTVFAPWSTQYDQGGLILAFPPAAPTSKDASASNADAAESSGAARKWIKAGIEFHDLHSVLGVVGTDRYSDWSLSPMDAGFHQKATFCIERRGTTVWVLARQEGSGEKMVPLREVKWAFLEGRIDGEIWVGAYAARPDKSESVGEEEEEEGGKSRGLEVSFSDLELVTEDDEE